MEELLKELIGEKVTYSRVGFGTILLVVVDNDNGVWVWNYWELWRGEELLATANDESTPMMSVAAHNLLDETIEEVYLDEDYGKELLSLAINSVLLDTEKLLDY